MHSALIGRSDELAALRAAMVRTAAGAGTHVHLVGEAGIGKTALLDAVEADLAGRAVPTRRSDANETDLRRPGAVLAALLPEASGGSDFLGAAIAAAEALALAGRAALLVDDVHWADPESLEALAALARRAGPLGLLVVTTTRPHPPAGPLQRLDDLAAASGRRLELAPLSGDELARFVVARAGAPPGPELSGLLSLAGGNPFLIGALLAALADEGAFQPLDPVGERLEVVPGTEVPHDLAGRLARHAIGTVPGGELVLKAAAVLPAGFTADEVARLLERPLGEVLTAVLAALGSGVVVDGGHRLAFRHELLRSSIERSTPPTIRRSLRRRAAAVLAGGSEVDAERAASCLLAACDPADPADRAHLRRTAAELRSRFPATAAELLALALAGLPVANPASLADTLELGWALLAAGRPSDVPPLLAERVAPLGGDLPVEALRLEGVALGLLGRLDELVARFDGLEPDHLPPALDPGDPDVVDALAESALLWISSGRLADARRVLARVARSTTPSSAFRRATVRAADAYLLTADGRFEAAVGAAREALAAVSADASGSATVGSPLVVLGLALDHLGSGDAALAALRRRPLPVGAPRWAEPLVQMATTLPLFRRGAWDDALAEAEAGRVGAEECNLGLCAFWPDAVVALIATARGDLDGARHRLERATAVVGRSVLGTEWLVHASALVADAGGDPEAAVVLVEALAAGIEAAGAPALHLNGGGESVRLALATGRRDLAEQIAAQLGLVASRTRSPVAAALARWAEGQCRGDAGAVAFAATLLERCGRRAEAARAWHVAAVLSAAAEDRTNARRLAGRAFRRYDELGAEHWHLRLRAELREAGLAMRPRRAPPRPSEGWEALTPSERAVVDLVSEGLTNTGVAERLVVSRRTVESHLRRVYTKLGLATRPQLVAAAARRP